MAFGSRMGCEIVLLFLGRLLKSSEPFDGHISKVSLTNGGFEYIPLF